ncbi:MAG: NADH-quinone oxidoreductase subunit NuoH [Candidatus Bathyarchaeota archaeon]|nr:NADH-quinone oxidoreductase subunit NuoH [Candidatus Bathyarchaeota archaeon]
MMAEDLVIQLINELLVPLFRFLLQPYIFVPLIYPGLLVVIVVIIFILWLERKIAGKVQLRYGPLYVSKRFGGIIQLIADLLRYLFAEVLVPKGADRFIFIFGPVLLFTSALLPLSTIPVGPNYAAITSELSLLISLSLLTIPPMFVLAMSWASNNKFSFIGGLREGYLMMAYEISLFLSILPMVILFKSLSFIEIIEGQTALWGIVLNPLAAIAFFITMLYATSKYPYEIAEADTEVVCGPYTEYSGILYGLSMGYAYIKTYALSLIFALIFLGGWNPILWPASLPPIWFGYSIPSDILLPGLMVFIKALIVMAFSVFLRTVYPRYRIDQAIKIGWHNLFTLSIVSVIISVLIVMLKSVI